MYVRRGEGAQRSDIEIVVHTQKHENMYIFLDAGNSSEATQVSSVGLVYNLVYQIFFGAAREYFLAQRAF